MNVQTCDILRTLLSEPFVSQRVLAEASGYSLGTVNQSIRYLLQEGYLTDDILPTEKALSEYASKAPRNAIVLAAGFGMRMVPINLSTPKALLKVHGEPLIERQIRQLHEVGVRDISIVVGFMKEKFEYLIDRYGVELVINPEYAVKNNLVSLSLVADRISNTYIIPSDIWCGQNPFRAHELYSWYMVSDLEDPESEVRVNRKMELVRVGEHVKGNAMIGIAFLLEEDARSLRERIKTEALRVENQESFWEIALYHHDRMIIPARVTPAADAVEINTYEQLRKLDGESNDLKNDVLSLIASVFQIRTDEITDIQVMKKGMTNRSFLFSVRDQKYIMRIPGEGTNLLINRRQEAEVFQAIKGHGLCDEPVYINPENGYKITGYLRGVRACDAENTEDLEKCMDLLRNFHALRLSVNHTFDIFRQIQFYETLRNGQPSVYQDYEKTKADVFRLKPFVDSLKKDWCLTHIDAVPDNFLFYQTEEGEALQLTDWEYSGMQDPHVDIAMFCIYSLYSKKQMDRLIDIYFQSACDPVTRAKIYAYISMCGLLWSNWCEFKMMYGVEFGEYSLRQYRYAKDYFRYAMKEKEGKSE